MKGIAIDVYEAEAFVSMEDGTNICVSVARLPSNIKSGSSVTLQNSSIQATNHRINGLTL